MVRRDTSTTNFWQSLNRIYFSFIWLTEPITDVGGGEPEYPEKTPYDEFQKLQITLLQYTDTGPVSPSADLITTGTEQENCRRPSFKSPVWSDWKKAGFNLRTCRSWGGRFTTQAVCLRVAQTLLLKTFLFGSRRSVLIVSLSWFYCVFLTEWVVESHYLVVTVVWRCFNSSKSKRKNKEQTRKLLSFRT